VEVGDGQVKGTVKGDLERVSLRGVRERGRIEAARGFRLLLEVLLFVVELPLLFLEQRMEVTGGAGAEVFAVMVGDIFAFRGYLFRVAS
jgi:hypothetical protein